MFGALGITIIIHGITSLLVTYKDKREGHGHGMAIADMLTILLFLLMTTVVTFLTIKTNDFSLIENALKTLTTTTLILIPILYIAAPIISGVLIAYTRFFLKLLLWLPGLLFDTKPLMKFLNWIMPNSCTRIKTTLNDGDDCPSWDVTYCKQDIGKGMWMSGVIKGILFFYWTIILICCAAMVPNQLPYGANWIFLAVFIVASIILTGGWLSLIHI